MPSAWHVSRDGKQYGPYSDEQLRARAGSGRLAPNDLVWKDGLPEWIQADRIKGLFARQADDARGEAAGPPPDDAFNFGGGGAARGGGPAPTLLPPVLDADLYKVIAESKGSSSGVEILHYRPLSGASSLPVAQSLYYAQQQGLFLKQARITLDRGSCRLQAKVLQYLRGDIAIETQTKSLGGLIAGTLKASVTGETLEKPRYTGSGEIFTEPTFGHLMVERLDNEQMVLADRVFYAADGGVAIEVTSLKSLMGGGVGKGLLAGSLGGQGFFQTALRGTGWVLLSLPVPATEIVKYTLTGSGDSLQVDGPFAMAWRGDIRFSVEKSTKTLVGSMLSGEGFLQTYRGRGEVWLAPTFSVYEGLQLGGLAEASSTEGDGLLTKLSKALETGRQHS